MKTAGFSFIRNAIKYGYPIEAAVRSVLPLCDVFYIAAGKSDDATAALVRSIAPDKVVVLDTVWDDNLREGGRVLALETDKAFQAIPGGHDWAFYIQGDEVLHEKHLPAVRHAMQTWKDDPAVEGLLFNYLHFYGSYDYVGDSLRWYRREVRVVRNDKNIFSYRDAQGFRKTGNKKLRVKAVDATIHHYGWVKDPRQQQQKAESFNRLWHSDDWVAQHVPKASEFDYGNIDALRRFEGTHPAVMQEWVARQNWAFDHDLARNRYTAKEKLRRWLLKKTGFLPGEYKNYVLV